MSLALAKHAASEPDNDELDTRVYTPLNIKGIKLANLTQSLAY